MNYEYLQSLTRRRTIQAQVVDHAKILIYKAQGASNSDITERIDVNINTVRLCIEKYMGWCPGCPFLTGRVRAFLRDN